MLSFDPNASGFSVANWLACAEASCLAYETPMAIEDRLKRAGFEQVTMLSSELGTGGFVASSQEQGVTVVSFRGTQPTSYRDIRTDLEVRMVGGDDDGHGPKVHMGFSRSLASVASLLREATRDWSKALFVTGHSLGGALAMLYADSCESHPPKSVYTFGQPRCGNGQFALQYDARLGERTFRLRNKADIVPHLPHFDFGWPSSPADTYWHAGTDVLSTVLGGLVFNPGLRTRILNDVLALATEWQTARHLALLEDHHSDLYLQAAVRVMADRQVRPTLNTWGQKQGGVR
jgi:triacylglycerol lipase